MGDIRFSTLHADGSESNVRLIKQADILKCPFQILVPMHYRNDGTCKCDDASHRAMMIRDWDYTPEDFADIPLR